MREEPLPSLQRYEASLRRTGEWLLESVANGRGGSSAYFSPLAGWSRPYPETTGYLIPTLLELTDHTADKRYLLAAHKLGEWLLNIQNSDGSWPGGLYPNSNLRGSVFNTGQILEGLLALYRSGRGSEYLEAAVRAAAWLADGVTDRGLWPAGDYQAGKTPAYYTQVAWPMLEVWRDTDSAQLKAAAVRFLDTAMHRRMDNGIFAGWGFRDTGPAFTHTIAYTLRGFIESSRLLDDPSYGNATELALSVLIRNAELRGGGMSGAFDGNFRPAARHVCLTGNAQIAICILLRERESVDLRLVSTAAKLVDFVCGVQRSAFVPKGMRGVAGSYPLWGRYMMMRYPNWAAKYHCDALLMLMARIRQEQ